MRHAKRQEIAQDAAKKKAEKKKSRGHPALRAVATLVFAGTLGFGGYQALMHPDTPLPAAWNPTQPLQISDPVTPITGWKLNRAVATIDQCTATLAGHARWQVMSDLQDSPQCHIRGRIDLRSVGQANLADVETRCALALRMAMWEQHSLQPAARDILGTQVSGIDHFGSYSCRRMRTSAGTSSRWSTHATANAIDIAGFRFADGRSTRLLRDWESGGEMADFLRAAKAGACDWFNLTLSPDYNALHADHFHLQSTGWGLCR